MVMVKLLKGSYAVPDCQCWSPGCNSIVSKDHRPQFGTGNGEVLLLKQINCGNFVSEFMIELNESDSEAEH